jgi:hypothetical protein
MRKNTPRGQLDPGQLLGDCGLKILAECRLDELATGKVFEFHKESALFLQFCEKQIPRPDQKHRDSG